MTAPRESLQPIEGAARPWRRRLSGPSGKSVVAYGASRPEAPMQQPLTLRPLAAEEAAALRRLAHSRTASARAVERARLCWLAHQGQTVPAIAVAVGVGAATARAWSKRFNRDGLAGLADRGRGGRPPTYTAAAIGDVIAASLTDPQHLGLPFATWTLDRLAAD